MSTGFNYFRFQGPMPPFEFGKMRFHGHAGILPRRVVTVGCCDISQAPRAAMCHAGIQSRLCLATGGRQGANFRQVLHLQHSLCAGLSTLLGPGSQRPLGLPDFFHAAGTAQPGRPHPRDLGPTCTSRYCSWNAKGLRLYA
jgi:hypothetical protein